MLLTYQPPSPLRAPAPALARNAEGAYTILLAEGAPARATLRVDPAADGARVYRVALWLADRDEAERYSLILPGGGAVVNRLADTRFGAIQLFFPELWEPLGEVGAKRTFSLTFTRKEAAEEVIVERLPDEDDRIRHYRLDGVVSHWELFTEEGRLVAMHGSHGVTIVRSGREEWFRQRRAALAGGAPEGK